MLSVIVSRGGKDSGILPVMVGACQGGGERRLRCAGDTAGIGFQEILDDQIGPPEMHVAVDEHGEEQTRIDRRQPRELASEHVLFPLMLQTLLGENDQHPARIRGEIAVVELSHRPPLTQPARGDPARACERYTSSKRAGSARTAVASVLRSVGSAALMRRA